MRIFYVIAALIATPIVVLLLSAQTSQTTGIRDTELGLSKTSVFEAPSPDSLIPNLSLPGETPPPPRRYLGAPPIIPHGIADFIPIRLDDNQCIDCHLVDEKIEGEPTPIPESHRIDLRNSPGVIGDFVAGARYNCVSCHVSTFDVEPLVPNSF